MGSSADKADLMSAYLDHELDEQETAEFEAFLETSTEAREEMEDLRKMLQVVGQMGEVQAPPDFYEKVANKARRRPWLPSDGLLLTLVSLPFQVLSIVVILAVAVTYMLTQLERDDAQIEKDTQAESAGAQEPGHQAPSAGEPDAQQ